MKKITHLLYLGAIAVLSVALWQQSTTPAATLSPAGDNDNQRLTHQGSERLAAATQPSQSADSAPVMNANANQAAMSQNAPPMTESDPLAGTELKLSELKEQLSPEQLDQLIRNHLNVDDVEQRLLTEAVDQDWAYEMKENIMLMYEDNEALQTAQINSIECRTTVCVVEFAGSDTPLDYMSRFHHAMATSNWFNSDYRSAMISNSTDNTHKIHIVRP
ncbi:hypothetical protein [Pseudidiomarina insulisalsae]|uniref:Uncharacterized protein n=1 Tax=Pseudidiomarina insulisalsae TaxID=575789 RepID=A0A432YEU9_9GAMM|nr:hypothetical protein [Pseudidiomarina insulisalsae]RUO59483.1 hypothetical protein CWI71_08675 [Pseudidiomarina insulisalsae]